MHVRVVCGLGFMHVRVWARVCPCVCLVRRTRVYEAAFANARPSDYMLASKGEAGLASVRLCVCPIVLSTVGF